MFTFFAYSVESMIARPKKIRFNGMKSSLGLSRYIDSAMAYAAFFKFNLILLYSFFLFCVHLNVMIRVMVSLSVIICDDFCTYSLKSAF